MAVTKQLVVPNGLGDSTPDKVAKGSTFTSDTGLLQTGTGMLVGADAFVLKSYSFTSGNSNLGYDSAKTITALHYSQQVVNNCAVLSNASNGVSDTYYQGEFYYDGNLVFIKINGVLYPMILKTSLTGYFNNYIFTINQDKQCIISLIDKRIRICKPNYTVELITM